MRKFQFLFGLSLLQRWRSCLSADFARKSFNSSLAFPYFNKFGKGESAMRPTRSFNSSLAFPYFNSTSSRSKTRGTRSFNSSLAFPYFNCTFCKPMRPALFSRRPHG